MLCCKHVPDAEKYREYKENTGAPARKANVLYRSFLHIIYKNDKDDLSREESEKMKTDKKSNKKGAEVEIFMFIDFNLLLNCHVYIY